VGQEDRGPPGKIRGVLRLIEQHPAALAYDFRARFGLPITSVFDGRMGWEEAWQLVQELAADPTSHLAAAVAGWDHPMSREALILADLFDLTVAANTDKRRRGRSKSYPRPFKRKGASTRSAKPTVDQSAIDAALRARGHQIPKERRG
jgi:hypothetical protein